MRDGTDADHSPLRLLVFLGSARQSTPPAPARLGARVARACQHWLDAHGLVNELIDALEIELSPVFKPHFSYASHKAPEHLETLAQKIAKADGYIMVSPEYNHCMSPALANLLNHFGSSLFSYKPSAIVTYSAGQWGGARAAVNMRTFLSELGCLPVSAMIHVPDADQVFDETGQCQPGADPTGWDNYFGRTIDQLVWWSQAARTQRLSVDVGSSASAPAAFTRTPSQRNAPT